MEDRTARGSAPSLKTRPRRTSAECAAELGRDEASAIVLLAKARVGELTAALPKLTKAEAGSRRELATKNDSLEAEGISRKEAAECEKIASLQNSMSICGRCRYVPVSTDW